MEKKFYKAIYPLDIVVYIFSFSFLLLMIFFKPNLRQGSVKNVTLKVSTPPQKLDAISGDKKVILIWYPPISNRGNPISEYVIYRKFDMGYYSEIGRSNSKTLSFVDSTFSKDIESYIYCVSAKTLAGESKHSNEVIIFPDSDSSQVSDNTSQY